MSRVLVSLLLVVCVGLVAGWTNKEVVTECPHHPGMCYDSVKQDFYGQGATWSRPGICAEYSCDFPEITGSGCSIASVEPPCYLETKPGLPYPDCCPQPRCPTINEI